MTEVTGGASADTQKQWAAERALDYVRSGMKLGLGTGSTAAKFVDLIGERVKDGLDVLCVPTSEATREQAESLDIPLTTLDDVPRLDLTVDGADELDDRLQLIKGGGGALLREKIVASASDRLVIIADASKRVPVLGEFPLPVEISVFGCRSVQDQVEWVAGQAGYEPEITLRQLDGSPFVSDGGNYILDCAFGRIDDPEYLSVCVSMLPGVVETGLFLGLADSAVIAGPDGVTILGKKP